MRRVLRIFLTSLALLPIVGSAEVHPDTAAADGQGALANGPDLAFLASAARANATEIAAGKLAVAQGHSAAVKAFGERMVTDHGAAGQRLDELAQAKHAPAPQNRTANSANLELLRHLSADAFDRAYADLMVGDHQQVISAFEREVADGTDPDVKTFASSTLPTLREHLSMARALSPGR